MNQNTHRRRGGRWLWVVGLAVGLVTGTLVALELANHSVPFAAAGKVGCYRQPRASAMM